MMAVDNSYFDFPTNRHNTDSYKWDSAPEEDILPLWVADMDFRTSPEIISALKEKVNEGIFGYVKVPETYYESLTNWFSTRHSWKICRESVIYTSGVVPAISAVIKALTHPGDGVIVQTPAYNCFFSSIRNNGCRIVENPLKRIDSAYGFSFEFDYDHLEQLAAEPDCRLMILCNPHNPTGRVWKRKELERISEICSRNNVIVISDEIHCELTRPGYSYTPFGAIDRNAVICCSPSKAFNIAGLQIANIITPSEEIRSRIDRAINDNEVCDVNPFGVVALQAAYNHGSQWLSALKEYLNANYLFLRDFFASNIPALKVCSLESTYLAWVDISSLGMGSVDFEKLAMHKGKVWINSGSMYGMEGYIRINFACPRSRLEDALRRLEGVISGLQSAQ